MNSVGFRGELRTKVIRKRFRLLVWLKDFLRGLTL